AGDRAYRAPPPSRLHAVRDGVLRPRHPRAGASVRREGAAGVPLTRIAPKIVDLARAGVVHPPPGGFMRSLAAAVALGVVCLAGSARAATVLFLDSQPGDYIGQGIPQRFTDRDGTFTASHDSKSGVSIDLESGPLGYWSLDFFAPLGSELMAGTYDGATRSPFQSPTGPGLSISGAGRGCNTLTGRFVVLDVTYGPTGDVVAFAADFEQHCEGGSAALFGSIRFRSGDAGCLGAV